MATNTYYLGTNNSHIIDLLSHPTYIPDAINSIILIPFS